LTGIALVGALVLLGNLFFGRLGDRHVRPLEVVMSVLWLVGWMPISRASGSVVSNSAMASRSSLVDLAVGFLAAHEHHAARLHHVAVQPDLGLQSADGLVFAGVDLDQLAERGRPR
jgi:hypothetical protein